MSTRLPVSVILPNYNYARYIESRIDGILNQTYPVSELIILDDASTDNSREIIQQKVHQLTISHPQVKVTILFNKTNSGNVFKQWQKGISTAKHDYIWICELDDECKPDFLATAMQGFQHDDQVILSYTNSQFIHTNNRHDIISELRNIKNYFREDRPHGAYIRDGREELAKVLAVYNTIPNVSAVVFRKSTKVDFQQVLAQAGRFHLAGDWYFYSELLLHGKIAYSPHKLNLHRIHSSSVTNQTDLQLRLQEISQIHTKIIKDLNLDQQAQIRLRTYEAKLAARWQK